MGAVARPTLIEQISSCDHFAPIVGTMEANDRRKMPMRGWPQQAIHWSDRAPCVGASGPGPKSPPRRRSFGV